MSSAHMSTCISDQALLAVQAHCSVIYRRLIHINIMVYVGIGFLMSFLRRYRSVLFTTNMSIS